MGIAVVAPRTGVRRNLATMMEKSSERPVFSAPGRGGALNAKGAECLPSYSKSRAGRAQGRPAACAVCHVATSGRAAYFTSSMGWAVAPAGVSRR